jgi:hypothetical protein
MSEERAPAESYEPPMSCCDCGEPLKAPNDYHLIAIPGAIYDAASCHACGATFILRKRSPEPAIVLEGVWRFFHGIPDLSALPSIDDLKNI